MIYRINLLYIVVFVFILQTTGFAQPYSNDFNPETTIQAPWTFYDPVGDATLTWTGTNAEISVPSGTGHDLWTGTSNRAPRMLQSAPNTDFQIEIKFESVPSSTYQLQGIIVQEDNDTFIRLGTYYGNGPKLFVAVINGTSLVQTPAVTAISSIPSYLRVTRTGNNWSYEYSSNGSAWNSAATFTQAFTVNQVGFYAGNAGANPAFTASADYFMNTADPITDTDVQGVTPPVVDIWYGDTQSFGNLGNPQQWINILGRVSDDNGIGGLTYKLNGGTAVSLAIGPNGTRLIGSGDFVTEIDHANLLVGVNTVEFTATDALGAQTIKTVTINYNTGNVWPLPYTADWSTLSSIENVSDVANIVDGLWELTPDGIRTAETGYDRLIVLGDETWTTDYEVTAEMIIHSGSSGSGVGFAIGWQGHTGTNSPRTQWPLEAIGWVRNFPSSPSLRILTYPGTIEDQLGVSISAGTKYLLKAKSEDIGGGLSKFSVKIWEYGTAEPVSYMITKDITNRNGSVLLITHQADVTWGTIQIDPITINQSPLFTSAPVTTGEVGQFYSYNITASDPNVTDVLTITAPALPGWLSLTDNGNGTAALSGTPTSGDAGSNSVELLVEDGNGGSDTQSFSIAVNNGTVTLPISDQFCGPTIGTGWTIFDPYDTGSGIQTGESQFSINNGALQISIPGNEGSHDLAQNLAPRVLQTIPDDDFGVEVKFNSVPTTQYQMQGIIVNTSGGGKLRFETYYGTAPTFYAYSYGVPFGSAAINQPIGGPIPAYLRLVRTGNTFQFDYSYDGTNWTNAVTKSLNVVVTEVGFYGANHTPNPAFILSAEYFRNIKDAIPTCGILEVISPNGGEVWTGGSTQNITWLSSGVTNVNIEFSSNNGANWSTFGSAVNASSGTFVFSVPPISSTNNLIRLSDTDYPNLTDVSDGVFTINTTVITPTLTIGSASTVSGSYVTIPVDLSVSSGFKIDFLLQGRINYDAGKLKFLYGLNGTGTLVNNFGWSGISYSAIPGTVDILLSGANPINTSGTLHYLVFQVIDGNAGSAGLTATSAGWPVDVIEQPLTIVNGTVTYTSHSGQSVNRGDATLNFIVDIHDALAVIYHWINLYPLTGQALINADADFDGDVDIDDYLRIIFFVYLHDWNFAFPNVSPGSSIVMDGGLDENNETIIIPVELVNSENVQSVEVKIEYDSSELEFVNVTSNASGNVNIRTAEKDGKLTLVAVSMEEMQNAEVAALRFKKLNSNSNIELNTSFKLNNQLTGGGLLSVGEGKLTNVEVGGNGIPKTFELTQNYPNPFNPSTVINFAVPKAGHYKLNIYNLLGQKLSSLIDKQLQAGYHSVIFNGSDLASGIYIYSLEGTQLNISKMMHLIK